MSAEFKSEIILTINQTKKLQKDKKRQNSMRGLDKNQKYDIMQETKMKNETERTFTNQTLWGK